MIDSKKRFSETAKVYDKYRPSYPKELVTWIINASKLKRGSSIADIGCGTGISTRLFLNRGFDVVGIDPNDDMLSVARKTDGDFYIKGEATKTGLQTHSIDLLVTAQAMHWFDLIPTLKEFKRVLKPGCWCFAFWNIRKETPILRDYNLLISRSSKEYSKTPKPDVVIKKLKTFKELKNIKEQEFSYSQKFNHKSLEGRAFSSSYIAHGVKDKELFKSELKRLFGKYQKNREVTFDYRTVAIAWLFT